MKSKNRVELSDLLDIDRVNIIHESEEKYTVKYQNNEYDILKSNESKFILSDSNPCSLSLDLSISKTLLPESGIYQKEDVPQIFKEVMMFHELKEMEYKKAGFEDAHKRAVNDEVGYAIKFLKNDAQEYFKFAKILRKDFKPSDYSEMISSIKGMKCVQINCKEEDWNTQMAIEILIDETERKQKWSTATFYDLSRKEKEGFSQRLSATTSKKLYKNLVETMITTKINPFDYKITKLEHTVN